MLGEVPILYWFIMAFPVLLDGYDVDFLVLGIMADFTKAVTLV